MNHEDRPMVHAVDFDGTLTTNGFPNIGDLRKNVVEKVRQRKENGGIIILWTTRTGDRLEEAIDFCEENDIPIDYVNENVPWIPFETSRRIFADEYICDRSFNPISDEIRDCIKFAGKQEI